jgi:hypothetical protein
METDAGLPPPFLGGVLLVEVGLATGVVPTVECEPVPEDPHATTNNVMQHKKNEIRNGRERIRYMIFSFQKLDIRHFFKHISYFAFYNHLYAEKLDFGGFLTPGYPCEYSGAYWQCSMQ